MDIKPPRRVKVVKKINVVEQVAETNEQIPAETPEITNIPTQNLSEKSKKHTVRNIIIAVISVLVVAGALLALWFCVFKPDYQEARDLTASALLLDEKIKAGGEENFGGLVLNDADDLTNISQNIQDYKQAIYDLKVFESKFSKNSKLYSSDVKDKFNELKELGETVIPALESMAIDSQTLVNFAINAYNAGFMDVVDGTSANFDFWTPEKIDEFVAPLLESNKQALKDVGTTLGDFLKQNIAFLNKYNDSEYAATHFDEMMAEYGSLEKLTKDVETVLDKLNFEGLTGVSESKIDEYFKKLSELQTILESKN